MANWFSVLVLLAGLLLGFVPPLVESDVTAPAGPVTVTKVARIDTSLQPAPTGRATLLASDRPFFPIGVTYHFTRHRSQWDTDLREMRELGLNTVRVDLSWRDVEPYFEGNYQFGFLDEFLDKAAQRGLYVVPVFSYATQDVNTPWWFWVFYHNWGVVGSDGATLWGDFPSINNADYRRLFTTYLRETVRHIASHPALLAYQVLNEPHYPKRPLSDYNTYTIAAYQQWTQNRYGALELLNASWFSDLKAWDQVKPPHASPSGSQANLDPGSLDQWRDWRQFTYDNLAGFVDELTATVRKEDPLHAVLVSEMSWWWWGEQPLTGVSPTDIYRSADVVGFDVYPEAGNHADYYGFNADLLTRLWEKPVWVTELNRKDGNPTSAEIQGFATRAVEGGASGLFYFQWRDSWTDGGAYGLLDSRGNKKSQFAGFAATVDWLRQNTQKLLSAALPQPDAIVVWPSESIATFPGAASPAHDVYTAALKLTSQGLRVGIVPEDQVASTEPRPRDANIRMRLGAE